VAYQAANQPAAAALKAMAPQRIRRSGNDGNSRWHLASLKKAYGES